MRVAIIEDDRNYKTILRDCLHGSDWQVVYFSDSYEFGKEAQVSSYDAIISDYYLPITNGMDILKAVWRRGYRPQMAIMSGYIDNIPDLNQPFINQVINKKDPQDIGRWLKYVKLKLETNKKVDKEIERIRHEKNGYKDSNK